MKSISKLALLLIVIFAYSCKSDNDSPGYLDQVIEGKDSPATESTEEYSVTYKYNEGVIVLDDAAQRYLQKVEADTILYFASNTPRNILPQTGSIISARATDKTPYGLGNKVLSSSTENGMTKCVTTSASLDDIFEVLEIESAFSLTSLMKDKDGLYDDEGNFYKTEIVDFYSETDEQPSRTAIGSLEAIQFPLRFNLNKNAYIEGNIAVGGILTFNKNTAAETFENSLEIGIKIGAEFGVESGDIDPKKLIDLIKNITIVNGTITVGPVVLRPHVKFGAALVGNGSITVGASTYWSYKCGWTEKGFFKGNTSPESTMEDIFKSLNISGKAAIGLQNSFDFGIGLYTNDLSLGLGIYPSIMIKGELQIGLENDAKMALDIDTDIKGWIRAKLFNKTLYEEDVTFLKLNLYDLEMRIFPLLESISIYETNYEPLTFNSQYTLKGGFFAKLLGAMPSFKVEKDGVELYHLVTGQELNPADNTNLTFELTDLARKTRYMGIPCLYIGDYCYEYEGQEFRSGDDRMDDLIPEEIRDLIEDYVPIYGGINPPNIEGTYFCSPLVLISSNVSGDTPGKGFTDKYKQFFNQDSIENTIEYRQRQGDSWGEGNGAFISGSGDNFTVFLSVIGENNGVSTKMTYLISGTKLAEGIKDLTYTLVMVDKGYDPDGIVIPIGSYRIIRDGDGFSPYSSQGSSSVPTPSSTETNKDNELSNDAAL